MGKFQLIVIFSMLFSMGVVAQNKTKKVKVYKIWIELTDNSKVRGVLYSAEINGIKIISGKSIDDSSLPNIAPQNINKIKIRRIGKIGRGAWIGAASGAGFGVAFGLIIDDEDTDGGLVAGGGGISFGILGIGVGIVVGANKKKVKINGEPSLYKDNLEFLQSISLVTNNSMKNN